LLVLDFQSWDFIPMSDLSKSDQHLIWSSKIHNDPTVYRNRP
jgi:hypothetical protein